VFDIGTNMFGIHVVFGFRLLDRTFIVCLKDVKGQEIELS